MVFNKNNNKLTLIPEIPGELKWFNTGFFVFGSISLILGMLGGFQYLLYSPSLELLMFIGGTIFLGIFMLSSVSIKSIQDKLYNILQSSRNIIIFTERSIVFKDVREGSIKKIIPSSELTRIDFQEKEKIIPSSVIGLPGPSYSFFYIQVTKTKVVKLNLQEGQEEIIQLEDYSNDKQEQNNLVDTIHEYCGEMYSEVEIATTINNLAEDNIAIQTE